MSRNPRGARYLVERLARTLFRAALVRGLRER